MNAHIPLKNLAEIKLCIASKGASQEKVKWVTPANLQEHNVITEIDGDNNLIPDVNLLIANHDILIKRINTSFISYIAECENNFYASNNLFILRAHNINPKYLAFTLDVLISEISKNLSKGTVFCSLSKKDLEGLEIPHVPEKQQEIIGNAWFYSTEKMKLAKKIADLEFQKEQQQLKKLYLEINSNDNF